MGLKYWVGSTLAAGVVIFLWGALSHTALPVPDPVSEFKNPDAMLEAAKAHTKGNGVYLDGRGLFLVLSLQPGSRDKSKDMGPELATEFAIDCLQALLMAILFARVAPASVKAGAGLGLLLGLIAWSAIDLSLWNWYGFSSKLVLGDLLDVPVGCALAGTIIAWLRKKWA
jgi:hypothetical protein